MATISMYENKIKPNSEFVSSANQNLNSVKFTSLDHEFEHNENHVENAYNHEDHTHKTHHPVILDHHMLTQHMKKKLLHGETKQEIYDKLQEHKWADTKLNRAFDSIQLTPVESEIMLGSFVTRALLKGHNIDKIRQSLLARSWDSKSVDKIINRIYNG